MKTKIFTLFFAFVASVGTIIAQTITHVGYGALYYDINTYNNTATVTSSGDGYSGDITIPETMYFNGKYYDVVGIQDCAFMNCTNLNSISMQKSIRDIGNSAFYGCSSLSSITISDSITYIANNLFHGCRNLTSIVIPENVSYIGEWAFARSGLTSIILPDSILYIDVCAFYECGNLNSVKLPNALAEINGCTFAFCTSINAINIPNSVTIIGEGAFGNCESLQSITIPNSVHYIGSGAFSVCKNLVSVILPNNISSIEYDTFALCGNLSSIAIPSSVTSIGWDAFNSCNKLKSVTCFATTPPEMLVSEDDENWIVFHNVDCSRIPLYVPTESIGAYKMADQWKDFASILPIGEGVDEIYGEKMGDTKFILNGHLFIEKNGKIYNTVGIEIK